MGFGDKKIKNLVSAGSDRSGSVCLNTFAHFLSGIFAFLARNHQRHEFRRHLAEICMTKWGLAVTATFLVTMFAECVPFHGMSQMMVKFKIQYLTIPFWGVVIATGSILYNL